MLRDALADVRGDVLEIGCGEGRLTVVRRAAIAEGRVRLVSVDPDADALARVRIDGATLHCAESETLLPKLADASFDHVVLSHAWNHLRDPDSVIDHVRRVLRPGGELWISDDVPFGLARTPRQQRAARRSTATWMHLRNDSAESAQRSIGARLDLIARRDVGPDTSNQWLLRYRRSPERATARDFRPLGRTCGGRRYASPPPLGPAAIPRMIARDRGHSLHEMATPRTSLAIVLTVVGGCTSAVGLGAESSSSSTDADDGSDASHGESGHGSGDSSSTGSTDEGVGEVFGDTASSDGGPSFDCSSGVLVGDVLVDTQDGIDALAGCESITGGLQITGAVTTLAPLASLREIGGSLLIGFVESDVAPSLTSLDGLDALEHVGEDITIEHMDELASITALGGLLQARSLNVRWLPSLTSLDGLDSFVEIAEELSLRGCPALTDVLPLHDLELVGTRLDLTELGITDLGGLESLSLGTDGVAVNVQIGSNPNLVSLDALVSVTWDERHSVDLYGNDALDDLSVFAAATELAWLGIEANPSLTTLAGFDALTVVHTKLALEDNLALVDIDALGELREVDVLEITGAQPLADLSGLAALEQVGTFTVQSTALTELGPLTSLVAATSIDVRYNDGLTDLDGLAALDSVAGRLEIVRNAALPQADAESWATGIDVGGLLKIDGNLGAPPPGDVCMWIGDGECDSAPELALCLEGSDRADCNQGPD